MKSSGCLHPKREGIQDPQPVQEHSPPECRGNILFSVMVRLFGEEMPYFRTERKTKTHAVRVARTVMLEAGHEYVVTGYAHIRGAC